MFVWWEWMDSNQLTLRTDLQSATPLQLRRTPLIILVEPAGFEPSVLPSESGVS